jgi:hypothetical protein
MLVHGAVHRVIETVEEDELIIGHSARGLERRGATVTGRLPDLQENAVCLRNVLYEVGAFFLVRPFAFEVFRVTGCLSELPVTLAEKDWMISVSPFMSS